MMNAEQAVAVDRLRRSGWEITYMRHGFTHLIRRQKGCESASGFPEFLEITVFPNGRIAHQEINKYPRWKT